MAHLVLLAFAYLSSGRTYVHTPSPTLPGTLLHFPSIMPPPDVYRDQLLALGMGMLSMSQIQVENYMYGWEMSGTSILAQVISIVSSMPSAIMDHR